MQFSFGPFVLDAEARRLTRDGEPVALADRPMKVLAHLVAHPGTVLSKDALVEAAWPGIAVTDNSLEQAISVLRRAIGVVPGGAPYIETVPRQGYRFTIAVTRHASRTTDEALDALLAPHRAWIEGRAGLETLEREGILRARTAFESLVSAMPDLAAGHIGLANALAMQFEMTRADESPDAGALAAAVQHARDACRLDPETAESWATLGFVLDRAGRRPDAAAAAKRAVTIEPGNWRHHFRLAYATWGEERLRAASRTLALLPGFPMAHWLAATVHVARCAFDDAARELAAGVRATADRRGAGPFNTVALHWLTGLVDLARGNEAAGLASLRRELDAEAAGHLYARECCANTWYAIGAVHLRSGRSAEALHALREALARVPRHPMARVTLAAAAGQPGASMTLPSGRGVVDEAMCRAAALVLGGEVSQAVSTVDAALAAAPPGNSGWILPIEPVLQVQSSSDAWATPLSRLRSRAA